MNDWNDIKTNTDTQLEYLGKYVLTKVGSDENMINMMECLKEYCDSLDFREDKLADWLADMVSDSTTNILQSLGVASYVYEIGSISRGMSKYLKTHFVKEGKKLMEWTEMDHTFKDVDESTLCFIGSIVENPNSVRDKNLELEEKYPELVGLVDSFIRSVGVESVLFVYNHLLNQDKSPEELDSYINYEIPCCDDVMRVIDDSRENASFALTRTEKDFGEDDFER